MPSRSRYTLLIPTYNRPDHLRRLLGYTPDALSYVRISPTSYGAAGSRSSAQLEVLRSWLELTRRPGWERRRAAFVAAAIWPDYRLRAVRALVEDPGWHRFSYWLSPLGPCGQDTISSPVMAHALRLLFSPMVSRQ